MCHAPAIPYATATTNSNSHHTVHLCTGQGHLTTDHTCSQLKGLCWALSLFFVPMPFVLFGLPVWPCFVFSFFDYWPWTVVWILTLLSLVLLVWPDLRTEMFYMHAIVYCLLYLCYIVNKYCILQMHLASVSLPDIKEIRMQSTSKCVSNGCNISRGSLAKQNNNHIISNNVE